MLPTAPGQKRANKKRRRSFWLQSFELPGGTYAVNFTGAFRPIGVGKKSVFFKPTNSQTVNISVPSSPDDRAPDHKVHLVRLVQLAKQEKLVRLEMTGLLDQRDQPGQKDQLGLLDLLVRKVKRAKRARRVSRVQLVAQRLHYYLLQILLMLMQNLVLAQRLFLVLVLL